MPASTPGCVHLDLLRNGEIEDPFAGDNERRLQWIEEEDWDYRCVFSASGPFQEKQFLVAEGLDTLTEVLINGHRLGRTENMFVAHRWRVDRHLRDGANEIRIRFESPMKAIRRVRRSHRPFDCQDPVGGCTRIRKQQCSFGWDWGPRFATCGIWKPIHLQGDEAEVPPFRIVTAFDGPDAVLSLEFSSPVPDRWAWEVEHDGKCLASGGAEPLRLRKAKRWWPRGEGEQPLHLVRVHTWDRAGRRAETTRRIGLRDIQLRQEPDAGGRSFEFVVNGRRLFAKGANWIPAHAFVAPLKREDYEPLLRSAVDAHMNILRVWGGGIYEHDAFYDLCDELGLLVWQDFMFACTLYPGDKPFLRSVQVEAVQQIRRLRHHPCLALWCGNNEIEIIPQNQALMKRHAPYRRAYDALFSGVLPEAVRAESPDIAYHRSSPLGSQTEGVPHAAPRQWGDAHNWDVFHSKAPLETYEASLHRFVSEFGMQALPSPEIVRTFLGEGRIDLSEEAMENHQKHPAGNEVILDYVLRRYRFPRDYAGLAYLSQLNQAEAMRVAIEHFRRHTPHTMGAIYWQFNDCWPTASWSGLEFGGRWRALHHEIRRLFAPVLLCPKIGGRVTRGKGNLPVREPGSAELWMACDAAGGTAGRLEWVLRDWDGRSLREGTSRVRLAHLESRNFGTLDLTGIDRENAYLFCRYLPRSGPPIETIRFFLPPRYLPLPKSAPVWKMARFSPSLATLNIEAAGYLHGVWIEGFRGLKSISDNFFDLEKGTSKEVVLTLDGTLSAATLRKALRMRSVVDA